MQKERHLTLFFFGMLLLFLGAGVLYTIGMAILRGLWRFSKILVVLLIGTPAVLVTSYLPIKRKGIRVCNWITVWMARRFISIMPIAFECREPEKFYQHRGFIFPNHDSYLDIILPVAIGPMRFLSMAEIKRFPFIGKIAEAVGTVFVDRENKGSRKAAREALLTTPKFPPVMLFPEGKIDGVEELQPFRYGAFEIAAETETPYLPAALLYAPFDLAESGTREIPAAVWHLAKSKRILKARLVALPVVTPSATDNPKELALTTHAAVSAALIAFDSNAEQYISDGL